MKNMDNYRHLSPGDTEQKDLADIDMNEGETNNGTIGGHETTKDAPVTTGATEPKKEGEKE